MIKECILDFDGVIVNSIKKIVEMYNTDFAYYENFKYVRWWEVQSWDFEECTLATKDYINSYFNQPRFFSGLEFMDNFEEVVLRLISEGYHFSIVSLGFKPNLIGKKLFIAQNMPYIDQFIGINLEEQNNKSGIDMRQAIFLDDSAHNLLTSNAAHKIVFGDVYPWNQDWRSLRCFNWWDFYKCVKKLEEFNEDN